MRSRPPLRKLYLAAIVGVIASCAAPDITASNSTASQRLFGDKSSPSLVSCPTNQTLTASGLIGALGGTLSVGGMSIAIPAHALLQDANVTVTVPASNYLEVDISVEGSEHFIFELPVIVTLSYARCSRSNIDFRPLTAWYIDSESKELLEQMPSIDNKLLRTVTFTTGHLSGYAIAN